VEAVKAEADARATVRIRRERELEDVLAADITRLNKLGYDLELRARQFTCGTHPARIDLLCYDRTAGHFVVVELKNEKAGRNTFAQICDYLGWIQDNKDAPNPPVGLVVARGFNVNFKSAASTNRNIHTATLKDIGLR
jgi:RecB family endonuclease NucS